MNAYSVKLLETLQHLKDASAPIVSAEEVFQTPEGCLNALRKYTAAKRELLHYACTTFDVPLGIDLRNHTMTAGVSIRRPGYPDLPLTIRHLWITQSCVGDATDPTGA